MGQIHNNNKKTLTSETVRLASCSANSAAVGRVTTTGGGGGCFLLEPLSLILGSFFAATPPPSTGCEVVLDAALRTMNKAWAGPCIQSDSPKWRRNSEPNPMDKEMKAQVEKVIANTTNKKLRRFVPWV